MKLNELRSMFQKEAPLPPPKLPPRPFGSDRLMDLDTGGGKPAKPIGRTMARVAKEVTIGGMDTWEAVKARLKRAAVALGWPSDVRLVRIPGRPGLVRSGDDILLIGHRGAKQSITFKVIGKMHRRKITYAIPEP